MTEKRITIHHISEYPGLHSQFSLDRAREHLQEARDHHPVDYVDDVQRSEQIAMLEDFVETMAKNVEAYNQREAEKHEADRKVAEELSASAKAETLAKLRPFFPGSDDEFEAKADQLYAEHQKREYDEAIARMSAGYGSL